MTMNIDQDWADGDRPAPYECIECGLLFLSDEDGWIGCERQMDPDMTDPVCSDCLLQHLVGCAECRAAHA